MAEEQTNFRNVDVSGTLVVDGASTLTGAVTAPAGITAPLTGNVIGDVIGNVTGYALKAVAAVATDTGATTGTIPAGATMVTVTSDSAAKIIVLPAPVVGLVVTIINGATGYELRSSAPATIGINGGTGNGAGSAVGANVVVVARCVSATAWIANTYAVDGTEAKLDAAS